MVDLNPFEDKVLRALIDIGATSEEKMKTADHVMKKTNLAKGIVGNALTSLVNKGLIKRVAREKASGYYVLQPKI
ncbi:MAG: transcriptional regulator [Candidatus Micrarchaeia archaeon]